MNYTIFFGGILLTLFIFLFSSCEKTTSPLPTKSVRDYTWRVDTLDYENSIQTLMRSMYAISENNIYLCGHNDAGNGNVWHFNGNNWKAIVHDIFTTVNRDAVSTNHVHGTSGDNIWIVGGKINYNPTPPPNFIYDSYIIEYDGVSWKEHLAKSPNGVFDAPISKDMIYSVFVASETNVWACGTGGLIYHYDGNSWDIDTLKMELKENELLTVKDIVIFNSELYALGFKSFPGNFFGTHYLLRKNEDGWIIEDSTFRSAFGRDIFKWGTKDFHLTKSNQLYSYGYDGIFKYSGTS